MSMEQIAQIVSISAGVLTALAILIAGIACFVSLIIKARKADSDGGSKITTKEWKEILTKLLPFGVKILKLVYKAEEEERARAPEPKEAEAEEKESETK